MKPPNTKRAASADGENGSQEDVRFGRRNASSDTKTSGLSQQLLHALHYASIGLPILPLNPGTGEALQSRLGTTDFSEVREWWNRAPDALVGLATGERSGIVAFDFGPAGRASLSEANISFPRDVIFPLENGRGRVFVSISDAHIFPDGVVLDGVRIYGEGGVVGLPPWSWTECGGGTHDGETLH